MATLAFDIGGVWEYLRDKFTDSFFDVRYLVLFESEYSESSYYPIQIFKYSKTVEKVITDLASEDFLNKFYKIRFYKDFALREELERLKSTMSDEDFQDFISQFKDMERYDFNRNWICELNHLIPDVLTKIIDQVRNWIGDLNLEDPAYTDEQYIQFIKFALMQYKGETNLLKVREEDVYLIQLLVRESIALNLAHDFAKYYKLSAPGAELDKSEISRHYIDVARSIREQYEAYEKRLNLKSGGYNEYGIINKMPSYEVNSIRRKSRIYGIYVDEGMILPKSLKNIRVYSPFRSNNLDYFDGSIKRN